MERRTRTALHDLVGLFLPRRCAGCDNALMGFEEAICLRCSTDFPHTYYHDDANNPVERLFQGKLLLEAASAMLRFSAEGTVQRMLHRLKYKGDVGVGLELGRHMARTAMGSRRFASIDALLAVPLHPRKEHQRGYNQSQVLVNGMRELWPLPSVHTELLRVVRTTSQTRRGRLDRWTNVKEAFQLADTSALENKRVLLVDDVVTTGSTIEACAQALSHVKGIRISVFTCACA